MSLATIWSHQGMDTPQLELVLNSHDGSRQTQLLGCGQGIQQRLITGSQTGSFSRPVTAASQGENQVPSNP